MFISPTVFKSATCRYYRYSLEKNSVVEETSATEYKEYKEIEFVVDHPTCSSIRFRVVSDHKDAMELRRSILQASNNSPQRRVLEMLDALINNFNKDIQALDALIRGMGITVNYKEPL